MDVTATLIEIVAFDPVANANVVARVTNRNDPRATTANGVEWLPILATAPSVGTAVFNGAFTGAGQIDLGDFVITLADGLGDAFTRLAWSGADVKIYAGNMQGGNFPLIFRAVGDGATRRGRLELSVSLTTRESLLNVNLLTQSYAGTGNLEGDVGLKGTMKPWVFGAARFCRPVLLDPVRQIWQVSAYGPVEAITNVFEGGQEIPNGSDFGGTLNDFLTGPGPAQGSWTRMKQYGLFRLGSQPLYQITCHVKGDTGAVVNGTALTKVGDIIGRILSLTTTMTVKASSLATLNANVGQPFDDYFEAQVTVTEVLTNFLLSVGGYYTFDESGNLIFGLVRFGAAVLNLDGMNRTEPAVMGINALPTSAPVWYLRLGAEQCHFVHDASNLPAVIANQGAAIANAQATADAKNKTFPTSTTPPAGAIDGDQWPDSSVSPTTMRRYSSASGTWVATSNQITTANQVPYASGQTIEALKPAQINSDKTSSNTASGIAGQGAFATINTAGYGSSLLTGFGLLSPLNALNFGSSYLLESSGGAQATLAAFKTIQGIAASITGQGGFATISSAAYGSSFLTGFGSLSPLSELFFGSPLLKEASGGAGATLANFKTIQGTASAITGQGAFATRNLFALSDNLLYDEGGFNLLNNLRIVTSQGTAAAITGQGWGATASETAASNVLVPVGANAQIDSAFTRGNATWTANNGNMTGVRLDFNRADYSGKRSVAYIWRAGATPAGQYSDAYGPGPYAQPGGLARMLKYSLPVKIGDRVGVRALVANHRCTASLFLLLYKADGVTLAVAPSTAVGAVSGGGVGGDGFGTMQFIHTVDNGDVAYAQLMIRMTGTGESDPYVFFSEPWIGKLAPGQTVIPPYAPGPADPTSDQTLTNTSAGFTGQGAFATLNSAAYGSNLLTGFGLLSPLSAVNFGSSYLLETSGGSQATLGNFKTIQGTAAAITGQGGLATVSSISGDGQLSGAMASRLAPFSGDVNYLAAGRIAWAGGNTVENLKPLEIGSNVTENRTAAAFTGQGALATKASVAYGSSFVTGFSTLASMSSVYFGSSFVTETSGGAQATLGNFKTIQGTAAAITGQGGLATASTISGDGQLSGQIANRLLPSNADGNYLAASRMAWDTTGDTVQNYKPQDKGANVTENRTAAAFSGQGALATKGYVKLGASDTQGSGLLTETGLGTTNAALITNLGTAAAITGQGWGATASETAASNKLVPVGINAQIDSAFSRGNATWTAAVSNIPGFRIDFNRADYSGKRSVAYIWSPTGGAVTSDMTGDAFGLGGYAVGGSQARMLRYGLPVKVGDTIAVRVLVANHRCNASLFLILQKSDGQTIIAPSTSVGAVSGGGANGDNFGTMQIVHTVDNGDVAYAQLMIRMTGTGEANPYIFFSEPWIGKLAPGQTVIPPYAPGPTDPMSDQTGSNTSAGFTGQGALATQNSAAFGTQITGLPYGIAATDSNGRLLSERMVYENAGTIQSFKPQEGGANITENRTAASITAQGGMATKDNVFLGTQTGRSAQLYTQNGFSTSDASVITINGTAAAITNQGFGATAAQALVDNRSVPVGINKVVNSNFARGTYGFIFQSDNQRGIDYPGYGGASGQRHVMYSRYPGTLATGSTVEAIVTKSPWLGSGLGSSEDVRQFGLSVRPGQRVYFGSLTGLHRCTGNLFALCYTSDGSMVFAPTIGLGEQGGGADGNPANFQKAESYFDVPTKAATGAAQDIAYVVLLWRMAGRGATDCFLFMAEPKLGIMAPGQTVIPDYVDGPPDPLSDKTGTNTAAAISGQGAFATVSTIAQSNVASYFNFNAFSLNYSITRSDGVSTVTEALAITSQGISSGFSGQGSLATMNTVGTPNIAANAITVPGYMTVDSGGSLGSFTSSWQDFDTATSGGGGTGGGGTGGGGGGACTTYDTMVLMANSARTGPGNEVRAESVAPGDWLWTAHEHTGVWAAYQVLSAERRFRPTFTVYARDLPAAFEGAHVRDFRATADHPYGGAPWKLVEDIGEFDGHDWVIAFQIDDAHTLITNGVLSHNKLVTQQP